MNPNPRPVSRNLKMTAEPLWKRESAANVGPIALIPLCWKGFQEHFPSTTGESGTQFYEPNCAPIPNQSLLIDASYLETRL